MNQSDVKRLALVLALQAEIEGMKAENEQRARLNQSVAYTEVEFCNHAEKLRNLAYAHDDQL